ncbi:MAG: hypothetical protein PVI43_01020 [Candidatus Bathyarchaeota archaeon]|jgi:hypothetical protein
MEPKDYLLNIPNPTQNVMQNVGQALSLRNMMEKRQMSQESHAQQMEIANLKRQEFERQIEIDKANRAAAARQAEAARRRQVEIGNVINDIAKRPNMSGKELYEVTLKYPELKGRVGDALDMMGQEEKQDFLQTATTVEAALMAGRTDLANEEFDRKIAAAESVGDKAKVAALQSQKKLINANPDAAMGISRLLQVQALGPEKYTENRKTMGELEKFEAEARKIEDLKPGELLKQAQEIGLPPQAISKVVKDNKGVPSSLLGDVMQMENIEIESGGLTPEQKFNQEEKLRKEYNDRISNFTQAETNLETIKASARDNSGAGDIALVTSFMKMLDPGSVVRETEFATARDTVGLLDGLKNKAEQIQNGQFLSPKQRQNFVDLAGEYMKAAKKHETKVRSGLTTVAKNYKLNTDNIFGQVEEAELGEKKVLERRRTADGRIVVKYSDGTYGVE